MNNGLERHELCKDRSRTVTEANGHFLAGDRVAEADARAIIVLLDVRNPRAGTSIKLDGRHPRTQHYRSSGLPSPSGLASACA
jgi:hypothetical protein